MAIFLITYVIIAVDTPMVLVTRLPPEDALKEFLWIAKVNGIADPQLTLQEIAEMKEM